MIKPSKAKTWKAQRSGQTLPVNGMWFEYFIVAAGFCLCVFPAWASTSSSAPPYDAGPAKTSPYNAESLQSEGNVDSQAAANRKMQRYEQRLQNLREGFGAYEASFSEAWLGLADSQQSLGLHKQAIVSFKQAMHVHRVNEGLFSLATIPIINRLIDSYAAVRNWKAVGQQHDFLLSLQVEAFPWPDIRLLPVLERQANWHMYAFFKGFDEMQFSHLKVARARYIQAVQLITHASNEMDLRLADFYRSLSVVEHYMNEIEDSQMEEQKRQERSNSFARGMGGEPVSSRFLIRKNKLSRFSSIKRMVALYEKSPVSPEGAYESAVVELADWQLLTGNRRLAFANYRKAYGSLSGSESNGDMLKTLFSAPKVLGQFSNNYSSYLTSDDESMQEGFVSMELKIDAVGRVKDIAVLKAQPNDRDRQRIAVRAVEKTMFRPKFVEGEAVAASDVRFRYKYYYPGESVPAQESNE